MNTDQRFRSYVRVTAVGLRAAVGLRCRRFLCSHCPHCLHSFYLSFFYNERRTPL